MRVLDKNILFGLYNDEEDLFRGVKECNKKHFDIWDVFTPFPVHGLDELMELKESRLHIAGFIYGTIGCLTGFLFMTWVFTQDWPIIFGGKPYWSVPAFIPITFELTVLFAAVGMVISYYSVNGQGPWVVNPVLDERITDDKFCLAFDADHATDEQLASYRALLESTGATEIRTKKI